MKLTKLMLDKDKYNEFDKKYPDGTLLELKDHPIKAYHYFNDLKESYHPISFRDILNQLYNNDV